MASKYAAPATSASAMSRARRRGGIFSPKWSRDATLLGMAVPGVMIFVGFLVAPVLASFLLSFTRWNGAGLPVFIGIANYLRLLTDPAFFEALLHTLVYAAAIITGQLASGLLLALLLNRAFRGVGFLRATFFAPALLSSAVVSLVWGFLYYPFGGVVPSIASAFGVKHGFFANPLGAPGLSLLAISAAVIWQFSGYIMVILLAGLKSIPETLYEAARIDGASRSRIFWSITWPLLTPATSVALTVSVAGNLRLFDHVYLLTGGGPAGATESVGTLIFKTAFSQSDFGYSTTQSAIWTLVTLLAVIIVRYVGRSRV